MAARYSLYRPYDTSNRRITILFFVCIIFHLIDAFVFQFSDNLFGWRLFIWIVVWIVGYWVLKPSDKPLDLPTLGLTLGLSALSFGIPYIIAAINFAVPSNASNLVAVFAPAWIIYLVYMNPDTPRWLYVIGQLYLIGWLIVFLLSAWRAGYFETASKATAALGLKPALINVREPLVWLWNLLKDSFVNAWKAVKDLSKKLNQTKSELIYGATRPDLYTAQVDQNAKEKLGVFLENIQKSQPDYYTDEPVSVWGTIVARTFDKPIRIGVNCTADKGTPQQKNGDQITPKESYEVIMSDEVDVDCSFKKNSFEKGSHQISLLVNFSFQTLAYQKAYFVDKSRAAALARENIDVLDYYGIKDKKPKAMYTNGPVMLGIDIQSNPIKLDRESSGDYIFTMGTSVKNQWEGRIVKVNELKIILPYFARMQDLKCGGGYEFEEKERGVYVLKTKLGPIKEYHSLRCPIVISPSSFNDVLGTTPISTQHFKVSVDYVYEFEKSISFVVKETAEERERIEKTRKTSPVITIADFQMDKNSPRVIELTDIASDAETKKEDLKFAIISQSNTDVVNCIIYQADKRMICTSKDKTGSSEIVLEVSDGANKPTKKFKITVGGSQQPPSGTGSGSTSTSTTTPPSGTGTNQGCDINNPIRCDGSMYKRKYPDRADGDCISDCEYLVRCGILDSGWSCQCTLSECNQLDANCRKGLCPGDKYCCKQIGTALDPCCNDCSCSLDNCVKCQNCELQIGELGYECKAKGIVQ